MLSLLDLELFLRRLSLLTVLVGGLVAAAIIVALRCTDELHARIEVLEREHEQIRLAAAIPKPLPVVEKTLLEERLEAFNATLGERQQLGSYVRTVFEHASKHALVLAQADYKLDIDRTGAFHTYQMTLPVRGPYPQLRGFVDTILASIPCVALEDVDFKRESIEARDTEARLRLVFFLKANGS